MASNQLNGARDRHRDTTPLDLKSPQKLIEYVVQVLTEQARISHEEFGVPDLRKNIAVLAPIIVESISSICFPITDESVYESAYNAFTRVVRAWLTSHGLEGAQRHHTSNYWAGKCLEILNKSENWPS